MTDSDSSHNLRFSSGFHTRYVNTLVASSLLLVLSLPNVELTPSGVLPVKFGDGSENLIRCMLFIWAAFSIMHYLVSFKEEPLRKWRELRNRRKSISETADKVLDQISEDHRNLLNIAGQISSKTYTRSSSIAENLFKSHLKSLLDFIPFTTTHKKPETIDQTEWNYIIETTINEYKKQIVEGLFKFPFDDFVNFNRYSQYGNLDELIENAKLELEKYTPHYKDLVRYTKNIKFHFNFNYSYALFVIFFLYGIISASLLIISSLHFVGNYVNPQFNSITHYLPQQKVNKAMPHKG